MLSAIAKPFGWLMLGLYNFAHDYGIAIFLFALIVRLILMPFSAKSKKSLMRSSRLQPIMRELEEKYGARTQKYQEEVAKLYREENINPMGGCVWTLIPFPILIALYQAIRFPITVMMSVGEEAYAKIQEVLSDLGFAATSADSAYIQIAESQFITKNFERFAGISDNLQKLDYTFLGMDLGATPSFRVWEFFSNGQEIWPQLGLFLIPVISALLSYLSMIISNKMSGSSSAESPNANMKTMTLVMPLVSLWIGFAMPGALGLYWIASSIFSALQDAILTRHYKKLVDAEDAAYREKTAALEAERAAKRAETEKRRAEGTTVTNPNTSKRKLAMQEKQKSEENEVERAIARGELKRDSAGRLVATGKESSSKEKVNPSAVGDRPYARGRNYKPDRFKKNYVPEDEELFVPEESAEMTEVVEEIVLPIEAEGTAGAAESAEPDYITAGEIGSEAEAAAEDKE